jgi:endoglucanase
MGNPQARFLDAPRCKRFHTLVPSEPNQRGFTVKGSKTRAVVVAGTCAVALAATIGAGAAQGPPTQFFVPPPNKGALAQISGLLAQQDKAGATRLRAMIETPHAVWFTSGTSAEVERDARTTVNRARGQHALAVLVAYNVPFRDCGQFSAGGARSTDEYLAWIDGLARGIGDEPAIVILEPDGLGIIPYNTDINGVQEWCRPDLTGTGLTPEESNEARYEQLRGAVDRLGELPRVRVYLDATHPAWLGVGDIADRLVEADVAHADGFFLNASNYQFTENAVQYGTWISRCIATGSFAGCPNQYWNGGPLPTKIAQLLGEWTGVALSPYGIWSDASDDPALNTSGINWRLTTPGTTHFVVDTSRNGRGPWTTSTPYPDKQDWCNPPGRGLGARPAGTPVAGNPLVDAFLWIKVPGESDGSCNRGVSGSTTDPEWGGIVDPPAGAWFPQQASQLAELASPGFQP